MTNSIILQSGSIFYQSRQEIPSIASKDLTTLNSIYLHLSPCLPLSALLAKAQNTQAPWVGSGLMLQPCILHPPFLRRKTRPPAQCRINGVEMQHHL